MNEYNKNQQLLIHSYGNENENRFILCRKHRRSMTQVSNARRYHHYTVSLLEV